MLTLKERNWQLIRCTVPARRFIKLCFYTDICIILGLQLQYLAAHSHNHAHKYDLSKV